MLNAGQLVVRRHGLPPFLNTFQAAAVEWNGMIGAGADGQRQGGPADASAGLTKVDGTWHGQERTWAWNPVDSEWQLLHVLRSGDTLWRMGSTYYGQSSMQNVHRIGDVEQNREIIGADASGDNAYALGVPGDVLLIPGLEQPGGQPPASPPGGSVPDPGGAQPPGTPDYGQRPPGYPADWPWPPGWATAPVEPPSGTGPTEPGEPAETTPVDAQTGVVRRESWWSPGKVVLVGGLGLTTLGLIVWGIASAGKPKRRKARKRKGGKRRRRR